MKDGSAMRLFDSHCHFETEDPAEIAAILSRARDAGVEKLLAVGGSDALNAAALAAQRIANEDLQRGDSIAAEPRRFPEVQVAIGFDREQLSLNSESLRLRFSALRKPAPAPVAIGEIGLDYHYSPETRDAQRALFAAQLDFARQSDKPVVIHTREAADDTIGLLKEIPSRGIIHCFTGDIAEARAYLDLGFYISISGIVTFKAADNVRATARYIPDDRILIETDSPYLAPVPMRGKPNEPAFLRHTCEFLANLRGLSPANRGLSPTNQRGLSPTEFAEMTFLNAEKAIY